MNVQGWLQEVLRHAALGLFAAYDASPLVREKATGRSFDVGVVIGFHSRQITGSMLLGMDAHAVQIAMPPCLTNWVEWAGELANQLMGRVLNQLSDYGIKAQMATPIVLQGDQLAVDGPAWGDVRLSVDGAPVGVSLRCTATPDFVPARIEAERPQEGDLLFF